MGVSFLKLNIMCGAAAVAVLALTGCSRGGSSTAPIATVGKVQISQKEFYDYLMRKQRFMTKVQGRDVVVAVNNSPGYQAMQDLILDRLLEEIAKEQGVFPSQADVEAELQIQVKQNPHMVDAALSSGYTMDELKEDFRRDLCRFRVQTKGVTVTPTEVDDYIKKNPKAFMEPPRVQASMIIVKAKTDEKAVDDALKSGQPFATVAQTYSIDREGAKTQFRYKETNEAAMPPAIQKLFDKTDELKTTDWQPLGKDNNSGFVKFYIEKKVKEKPIDITDYVKESIKRGLMTQKGQKAGVNVNKLIADKVQAEKDSITINLKQNEGTWKEFTVQIGEALAAQKGDISNLGGGSSGAATPGTAPTTPPATGAPAGAK